MRLRKTKLAASFLGVCLSTTLAISQDPSGAVMPEPSGTVMPDLGYTRPMASDVVDPTPTGWNLDWQWRFQADALYLKRNNHWRDIPVIEGPEAFRPSNLNFDYKAGARLSLGIMDDDFELDAVFTTLNDWKTSQSGVLANGVDFDGPVAFGAAVPPARTTVDPGGTPNFITSSTFFAPMNTAALTGLEADELEFLKPGAKFSQSYNTGYQDFELNYKRRPQPGRFARFGIGYRNVQFDEHGLTALSGSFDTIDSAGGEAVGNNGLADGSLTGAGLTLASGTANGFSQNTAPTAPDELLFTTRIHANNQLNGAQLTADFVILESDYFEFGAFGKTGVFHNFASGSITERFADTLNDKSNYSRTLSSSKQVASFLGQAGLTGRLFLRQNVRLFGSYEAIFLSGVALAPDQMRAITTTVVPAASLDLRTQGSAFMHGGRLGVEILFP